MLDILTDPVSASAWCHNHRNLKHSIGYVPTMGALHAGHLSLIERAIDENDVSCVSIFVNPLQFNDPKDYLSYPRDLKFDLKILREFGCDMVFTGDNREMFPEASSIEEVKILDPGIFAQGLEGEFRPGHLEGVCTVVDRLFRFVGPCRAYFGLKDFQQLLVIQNLADRFGYPEVIPCPTIRDKLGLALSSRNQLIKPADLIIATQIYRALLSAKKCWQTGNQNCDSLRAAMYRVLSSSTLKVEYADVRDPMNWQGESPMGEIPRAVALIAARINNVRLIDNLRLDQSECLTEPSAIVN